MSWPILAAIRENSDFGVARGRAPFAYGVESRRRDSAGDFAEREEIEETAAWNSAVRSTAIPTNTSENRSQETSVSSILFSLIPFALLLAFLLVARSRRFPHR